jgi:hypothetical protein
MRSPDVVVVTEVRNDWPLIRACCQSMPSTEFQTVSPLP